MILTVNSDYLLIQRQPVDRCNGEVWCSLWGTCWILKYYSDDLRCMRYHHCLLPLSTRNLVLLSTNIKNNMWHTVTKNTFKNNMCFWLAIWSHYRYFVIIVINDCFKILIYPGILCYAVRLSSAFDYMLCSPALKALYTITWKHWYLFGTAARVSTRQRTLSRYFTPPPPPPVVYLEPYLKFWMWLYSILQRFYKKLYTVSQTTGSLIGCALLHNIKIQIHWKFALHNGPNFMVVTYF
jgi:hypothetical protein